MTRQTTRALFDRLPRLVDLVAFTALADGLPTPVEQTDTRLWVQREEHTTSAYGGNKVRKFEFLFPVAERRGGPMLTAGGVGSHHVLAAAVHAQRLGLDVDAVLYRQPETDDVAHTRAALEAGTATLLALAGWRPRLAKLRVARQWFGARYGRPTRAGDEAIRIADEMGLELEPTYTAKAFAAALDQLGRGRRVAFIQTFAGTTASA